MINADLDIAAGTRKEGFAHEIDDLAGVNGAGNLGRLGCWNGLVIVMLTWH